MHINSTFIFLLTTDSFCIFPISFLSWGKARLCLLPDQGQFLHVVFFFLFFNLILFTFREEGMGGRKTVMCERYMISVASRASPNWGPSPQIRHVPWMGNKLVTFQFPGQHSIHWATPAMPPCILKATLSCFYELCSVLIYPVFPPLLASSSRAGIHYWL